MGKKGQGTGEAGAKNKGERRGRGGRPLDVHPLVAVKSREAGTIDISRISAGCVSTFSIMGRPSPPTSRFTPLVLLHHERQRHPLPNAS